MGRTFEKQFDLDVAVLAENILYDTAEAMIRYMESSDIIPVDTHNLKDSTGIGVYIEGTLKMFRLNSRATVPKNIEGVNLWGRDLIVHALYQGQTEYSQGYKIVLFSTMPYASYQDEGRNKGFFSDLLVDQFIGLLDEIMKRYATERN